MKIQTSLGPYLDLLFTLDGLQNSGPASWAQPEYTSQAIEHQDSERSKVFLVTYHNRILEIPRTAVVKDMWEGAKWPRDDPLPFNE